MFQTGDLRSFRRDCHPRTLDAGTKKPEHRKTSQQPISFDKWYTQLKELAANDPETLNVLNLATNRVFHAPARDALLSLLYTYVCGAPAALRHTLNITHCECVRLAKQMREFAGEIKRFDKMRAGLDFRKILGELERAAATSSEPTEQIQWADSLDTLPDWKKELFSAVEQSKKNVLAFSFALEVMAAIPASEHHQFAWYAARYNRLSDVLLGLSQILEKIAVIGTRTFVVPDRKRVQTRALALLYFHLCLSRGTTDYRTASDLAELLRPAYEAAGTLREDLTYQTVIQRINRFQEQHPEEALLFKEAVGDGVLSDPWIVQYLLERTRRVVRRFTST